MCLKTRCHLIPASKFVVEHTIEGSPVYDVASRITEVMIAKLTDHAVANVIELFV